MKNLRVTMRTTAERSQLLHREVWGELEGETSSIAGTMRVAVEDLML